MTTNLKLLLFSPYRLKYFEQTRRHKFFTECLVKFPLSLSCPPSTQADSCPNLFQKPQQRWLSVQKIPRLIATWWVAIKRCISLVRGRIPLVAEVEQFRSSQRWNNSGRHRGGTIPLVTEVEQFRSSQRWNNSGRRRGGTIPVVAGVEQFRSSQRWNNSGRRRGGKILHSVFKESKQKFLRDSEHFARLEKWAKPLLPSGS